MMYSALHILHAFRLRREGMPPVELFLFYTPSPAARVLPLGRGRALGGMR